MRWLLLVFIALVWPAQPAAVAAAGTVLTLSAEPAQVGPGERVVVTATLQDAAALYGFELHLKFDPTLLQVVPGADATAAKPGDLLSADFVAQNRFDNAAGTIDYAVVQVSPSEPVTGSGALGTFVLTAVGSGETSVSINSFTLSDLDGIRLPAQQSDARISIRGAVNVSPTAAATAEPAQTLPATVPAAPGADPSSAPATIPAIHAVEPAATGAPVAGAPASSPTSASAPVAVVAAATTLPGTAVTAGPEGGAIAGGESAGDATAGSASAAAGAPAMPEPTAEPQTVVAAVSSATPTAQRVAAAMADEAAALRAPTRVETRAAAARRERPEWMLAAGIAFVTLALALLVGLRLAGKFSGARSR